MPKTLNDLEKRQLVEKKKEVNESVSRSIDKIFKAKDAWNGKPAPEIGVTEPHSITEPIPEKALEAMDEAINTLNRAADKIKQIANEQGGQAQLKERKDKDNKSKLDLSALGSNPLSRFVSHIKAPFQFGDSNKWSRLKLLRSAVNAKDHLKDINSLILTKSDIAIPKAIYKSKDLYYIIDNELFEPITQALRSLPEIPKKEPELESVPEYPDPNEMQERTSDSNHPYEYVEIEYGLKSIRNELLELRKRLSPESFKPLEEKWRMLNRKRDYVQSLLKTNYNAAEIEHRNLINEMQDFRNDVDSISMNFEKEANKFTRFLKRKNIEYLTSPSNSQKEIRLKADYQIEKMYSIIDDLMVALEKSNIDPSSLSSYIIKLSKGMSSLYETIYTLGEIYNSNVKILKHKARASGKKSPLDSISNTDLNAIRKMVSEMNEISLKIQTLKEQRE